MDECTAITLYKNVDRSVKYFCTRNKLITAVWEKSKYCSGTPILMEYERCVFFFFWGEVVYFCCCCGVAARRGYSSGACAYAMLYTPLLFCLFYNATGLFHAATGSYGRF